MGANDSQIIANGRLPSAERVASAAVPEIRLAVSDLRP